MIRTYLDTGVLIAAFNGSDEASERAMQFVEDENRVFITSDILALELLPKARFHAQQTEADFYELFFQQATQHVITQPAHIQRAIALASEYGLAACDALHAALAADAEASEFITAEKPSKPFFRLNVPGMRIVSCR
jgi:predicted nucleic acid-binding protein